MEDLPDESEEADEGGGCGPGGPPLQAFPSSVRIDPVVGVAAEMLRHLITDKRIDFVIGLNAPLSCVKADASHLELIVMNLALNAADAMAEGGTICIETAPLFVDEQFAALCLSTPPGHYVQLMVSDTGTGTSPGTGSAVYGIVKQMGGSISLHSTPGLGSTFRILLPEAGAVAPMDTPAAGEDVAAGSETVLVVEDDAGVRGYIREIFAGHGYLVLEAGSYAEALDRVLRHPGPIDMLLTDFALPGARGDEIARGVKQMCPGITVLMISGYTDRIGIRSDEGHLFLQKPFVPAELLKLTRELLDARVGPLAGETV